MEVAVDESAEVEEELKVLVDEAEEELKVLVEVKVVDDVLVLVVEVAPVDVVALVEELLDDDELVDPADEADVMVAEDDAVDSAELPVELEEDVVKVVVDCEL